MTQVDRRAHWSRIMQAQAASGQTIKAFWAERKIRVMSPYHDFW